MRLAQKIYLIAGLPMICATIMTGLFVQVKYTQWNEARVMDRSISLMLDSSRLVTEMQKERGKSSLYLGQSITRDELSGQRRQTDELMPAFEASLVNAQLPAESSDGAMQAVRQLSALRGDVEKHIPAPESLKRYTQIITELLALNSKLAQGRTGGELGKVMSSVVVLEQAKESAGLLRGTLSAALSRDGPLEADLTAALKRHHAGLSVNLFSPILMISKESTQQQKNIATGSSWAELDGVVSTVIDRRREGKYGIGAAQVFAQLTRIIEPIDEMTVRELTAVRKTAAEYRAQSGRALVIACVGLLTGVVLLAAFTVWTVRTIIGRVAKLVQRAEDVAAGDLSAEALEIRGLDEISRLMQEVNNMQASLASLVSDVIRDASEVASASTEIAASAEEMALGMKAQAEQVLQISSAVEEMTQSAAEVAHKSSDTAISANDAGNAAKEGGTVVAQTVEGMNRISESVREGAAAVSELGKRSEQIGQIIAVINDIADQTNLLALNAAIEAARAGVHGRGFAVVADEVRKLADRTTKATEEIAGSIKAIQTETGQAVNRMSAGTEHVKAGVERVTLAGDSLRKIVTSSQSVATMMQSIAAAAEEQSATSGEISKNIESISAVTQQTTEGAQQAAMASAQLSTKAESLKNLVGRFKLRSQGTARRAAAKAGAVTG